MGIWIGSKILLGLKKLVKFPPGTLFVVRLAIKKDSFTQRTP
jgi:hypothetical protein